MATLQFCSELDKVWPEAGTNSTLFIYCAYKHPIARILSSAHLSYTKVLTLHIITLYITEIKMLVVH